MVVTAKVELELPTLAVRVAGDSVMPKFCNSEWTVRARFPECVIPADVPLAVTVKLPAVAAGMERRSFWLPPVGMLNGEAGDVATPAGNPERVTATGSANPF